MPSATIVASIRSANEIRPDGERLARAVRLDAVDQRAVELDELRLEPQDVAEARESGAGIVDRHARAELAHGVERTAQARRSR